MFFAPKVKSIKPDQLTPESCKSATIIDVRTEEEHAQACLDQPHIHIPMDAIDPAALVAQHGLSKDSMLYILCLGGKRAAVVAEALGKAGFTNVFVIEGGLMGCQACGQALRKG